MRPFQILQTCLQNCQVRHREVELAEVGKIPLAVSAPVFVRQFLGERLYQFLAVLGAFLPVSMICLMSLITCEKFCEKFTVMESLYLIFFVLLHRSPGRSSPSFQLLVMNPVFFVSCRKGTTILIVSTHFHYPFFFQYV